MSLTVEVVNLKPVDSIKPMSVHTLKLKQKRCLFQTEKSNEPKENKEIGKLFVNGEIKLK